MMNPHGTVDHVFADVADRMSEGALLLGVKNTRAISRAFVRRLEENGMLLHTLDRKALGGRAVDAALVNPLTLRAMTGSSSGTALNVLYHINDLGLGTDGGGSVLAPAASVNLYAFISPSLDRENMSAFAKTSTDGITFTPSLGFIARDLGTLRRPIGLFFDIAKVSYRRLEVPGDLDIYGPRAPLVSYLKDAVQPGCVLVSREGPVDQKGIGDTIYGHHDEATVAGQRASGKGLMRVVNMAGLAAAAIPTERLGWTDIVIARDDDEGVGAILAEASRLDAGRSALVDRYFGDLDAYFDEWRA